jgi:hypothetical protein
MRTGGMNTEPIKDAVRLCFVGEGNDDQPADIVLSRERTVGWVRDKESLFGTFGSNFGG